MLILDQSLLSNVVYMHLLIISVIVCPINANNVICSEENECLGKTKYCHDNEDCYIYITGNYAGQNGKFYCPNSNNLCHIECAGSYTTPCLNARFYANNISSSGSRLELISYGTYRAIDTSKIYCPIDGECIFECNPYNQSIVTSCAFTTIYATNSMKYDIRY